MTDGQGRKPAKANSSEREYLLAKLEEIRKDCQWLVGLGAASVFGVVVGGEVVTGSMRRIVFALIAAQMIVALAGAMSFMKQEVDRADVIVHLKNTLKTRYIFRNLSLLLFASGFLYLGAMTLF